MGGTHKELLKRSSFFMIMKKWKISSIADLEEILNIRLFKIEKNTCVDEYYSNYISIPKKNGYRSVCSIDKTNCMYRIQYNLKRNFLDKIYVSDAVYGFVKGNNYFDYLNEHLVQDNNRFFLRIDIKDFFNSITGEHIVDSFDYYVEGDEKEDIIEWLKWALLFDEKLIQGTPTAPAVSNIVFRPLDIRIERYCDKCGVTYSRYADDLLFSTSKKGILDYRFIKTISRILASKGFKVNRSKTRMSEGQISLNGFVLGKDIHLSRKKRKRIGGMLFYLETKGFKNKKEWYESFSSYMSRLGESDFQRKNDVINVLAGYRSFLILVSRYSKEINQRKRIDKTIKRIEKQLQKISR